MFNPTPDANNMNNTNNTLAELREAAKIEQQDLAFLLMSNAENLSKIERGSNDPSLDTIISYHMLFGAPLETIFADVHTDQRARILERSKKLISILKRTKSPKSLYRIKSIEGIVKKLIHNGYGTRD